MNLFKLELTPPLRALSAFALLALAAPAAHADESDYKILDWIESTSGGNQYIDTGIFAQSGLYVETVMMWHAYAKDNQVIGYRGSSTKDPRVSPICLSSNTQGRWAYYYYSASSTVPVASYLNVEGEGVEIKYTVKSKLVEGSQQLEVYNHSNDKTHYAEGTTATPGQFTLDKTMYVFGQNKNGAFSDASWIRIYTMDIYTNATAESNGVLARQFVAARTRVPGADGKYIVGFYDRKSRSFFPNKSSTPFYYEEKGAKVSVAVAPSLFGTVSPEVTAAGAELVPETDALTYTLSGATLFDDGVTGYWDANMAWRAEFDKAVYTPLGGEAEEIAEPTFTRSVGTGASVVWNFKNIKCRLAASASGEGSVSFANGKASYWAVSNEVVTLTATPNAGAAFVGWVGDVRGIEDTSSPTIEITNAGARELTARFVRIPSEYRALNWIESTTNGNQYINTGIKGQSGVYVEADLMWHEIRRDTCILGCRQGSDKVEQCVPIFINQKQLYYASTFAIGGTLNVARGLDWTGEGADVRYYIKSLLADGKQRVEFFNGDTAKSYAAEATVSKSYEMPQNMYALARNFNGTADEFAWARIYSMQIYTNATADSKGVLARDLVPVRRREDNAIGFYDQVSGELFENKGTIPFEYEEGGAPVSVAAAPAPYGSFDPILGEFGAETPAVTYTLSDAVTFDDGVVGYWNSNETWRAELDKVVYTPVNGSAEEVFATNFTRTVGAGASVVWNFKNVKCRIGTETVGPGRVVVDGREGFKWIEADKTVTVKAIPALGARFVEWTGDTTGIADVHSPNVTLTVDGARTLTARFAKAPRKYEALDYIESTKEDANGNLVNGNQYIDTGVLGVTGVVARASMMWIVKPPAGTCFLGSRPNKADSGDQRFMFIGTVQNSNPLFQMGVANGSTPTAGASAIILSNRVEVLAREVDNGEEGTAFSLTVGKSTVSGTSATQPIPELARTCYIFAQNFGSAQSFAGARLYSLQIWSGVTDDSDGTLVRDFVPVRVKRGAREGEIGLYDCVSGQFFENKNASAPPFLYGELPPSDYVPGFSVLVR